jgi:F0F1-type ATP synthase delta subunit
MPVLDKVVESYAQGLLTVAEEKSSETLSKTKKDMACILSYMKYSSLKEFLSSSYVTKDNKLDMIDWIFSPKLIAAPPVPPQTDNPVKEGAGLHGIVLDHTTGRYTTMIVPPYPPELISVQTSPVQTTTLSFLKLLVDRGIIGFVDKIAIRYLELCIILRKLGIAIITVPYLTDFLITSKVRDQINELLEVLISNYWRGKSKNIKRLKYKFKSTKDLIAGFTVQINSTLFDCSVSGELSRLVKFLDFQDDDFGYYYI